MSVHRGLVSAERRTMHAHERPVRDWCAHCKAYTDQWVARLDGPSGHPDQVCTTCTTVTYCTQRHEARITP